MCLPFSFREHRKLVERMAGSCSIDKLISRGWQGREEGDRLAAFLDFCEKFDAASARRPQGRQSPVGRHEGSLAERFHFPRQYDFQKRVCFTLSEQAARSVRSATPLQEQDAARVCALLTLFVDFQARCASAKVLKLVRARAALPIAKSRGLLCKLLHENDVVIVAGDTGCGKSTQVPQYLLADLRDVYPRLPRIVCTQPRRIACMSLCQRVSAETLNEYGDRVAYQIRFETNKARDSRVLFVTEGILLRQFGADPTFSQYDIIVCDEVHERHLFGDFLLALLKDVVRQRRGTLKLVLMSATINLGLFGDFFGGKAPIVQVPGRLFPIDVQYWGEIAPSAAPGSFATPYLSVLAHIESAYAPTERGDVLVFLPGIKEIIVLASEVRKRMDAKRWIVLPLHSALSVEEQQRVFDVAPLGARKVILATNIAETSITIDGVRFVVDSGKVKEMGFDQRTKINHLQEYWVSKASAEQRKGRAGRTGPGTCFRLYSRAEYEHFLAFQVPEMQRVSLETVVLQIKAHLGMDPLSFAYLEPPSAERIESALDALQRMQALDGSAGRAVTTLGAVLADLPVDPSIGKILVFSTLLDVVDSVLVMTAGMAVQTPFLSSEFVFSTHGRGAKDVKIETAHGEFQSTYGDPFALLTLFHAWMQVKDRHGDSRTWCRERFVEEQRLYEITKLVRQFKDILGSSGVFGRHVREQVREEQEYIRRQRKELRELQHTQQRKVKFLKTEGDADGAGDDDGDSTDGAVDFRDLDFVLSNNFALCPRDPAHQSAADFLLEQLALCSGLYPNVAYGAEQNSALPAREHTYHTRTKERIAMHPSSAFSRSADSIGGNDVLFYETLLQTNKTYIVSPVRVPALPFLLLLGQSIDTDATCTVVVVDEWLEFSFPSDRPAHGVLCDAFALRRQLSRVIGEKFASSTWTARSAAPRSFDAEHSGHGRKRTRTECREDELADFSGGLFREVRQHTGTAHITDSVPPQLHPLVEPHAQTALAASELSRRIATFLDTASKTPHRLRRLHGFEIRELFGEKSVQYESVHENETLRTKEQAAQRAAAADAGSRECASKRPPALDAMAALELAQAESEDTHVRAQGVLLNDLVWFGSIPKRLPHFATQHPHDALYKTLDGEEVGGLRKYVCLICHSTYILTEPQLREHLERCAKQHPEVRATVSSGTQKPALAALSEVAPPEPRAATSTGCAARRSVLTCDVCGETRMMTPIELLKHRKECVGKRGGAACHR